MTAAPSEAGDGFRVSANAAAHRYEVYLGATLAGHADYHAEPGLVTLVHTEIDPAFEGQGIGSRFVAAVLDDIRSQGSKVLPVCPFVRDYFQRHPEQADLIRSP